MNPGGEKRVKGFSADIFFLKVFFRITHDGLSERGTTYSLFTYIRTCIHASFIIFPHGGFSN